MQQPQLSNRRDFCLEPFRRSDNRWAAWQLISTLLPTTLLWISVPWIWRQPGAATLLLVPVLALLILFSARSFSLMHDCGHGSLFRSRAMNRLTGFLLGVVNAIPQYPWSRGHAFHHRHNGNWDRYRGPSALLSVEQFQQLSPRQQQHYGLMRHPLMLFPGGFFYLVVRPRLQLLLGIWEWACAIAGQIQQEGWLVLRTLKGRTLAFQSSHWYTGAEFVDLFANNLCVLITWWLMGCWLGHGLFWSCYAVVMTCSAAIFICIFFVQHNFPDSYAHTSADWSYFKGALEGSSNLLLPGILNWFSADIAFHSIHHLCERIPNYRLKACHQANGHLLGGCTYLRLADLPGCFKLILWDSANQKLVAMADVLG